MLAEAAHAATPEQGQLDASPTLFAVMAAINAAGYDADVSSPNNSPLRETIRKELAARQIPSLPALKSFYLEHRQSDPTAESEPIHFLRPIGGRLRPISHRKAAQWTCRRMPRRSTVSARCWRGFIAKPTSKTSGTESQPAFEQAIERYHEPVSEAVLQVNGFLRNETSGASGGWFQIYIDLLGAPNQIQTRNYGRNYYVVITPSAEPRIHDVRHAYLHYLLDPYGHPPRGNHHAQPRPVRSRAARAGAGPILQIGLPAAGHRVAH